jgi:hypothetical protein
LYPRTEAETTVINALSGILREHGFEHVSHDSPVAREQARAMNLVYPDGDLLVRSDARLLLGVDLGIRFKGKKSTYSSVTFRILTPQGRELQPSYSFGFDGTQADSAFLRQAVARVLDAVKEAALGASPS